jgi:Leucine-rich repeat (LRR) protein
MLFQVWNNQLKSLPPELGLLTNLKRLHVRHSRQANRDLNLRRACFQVGSNLLTSLPAEIGQLTKVEVLYVRVSN